MLVLAGLLAYFSTSANLNPWLPWHEEGKPQWSVSNVLAEMTPKMDLGHPYGVANLRMSVF